MRMEKHLCIEHYMKTTLMELFQYYSWYSISSLFLPNLFFLLLVSKIINLYKFLQLCKYYVRVVCLKSQREQMSWHLYEFGNNLMKMCSNTKQKWKLTIEFLKIRTMFISSRLQYVMKDFLSWVFYVWACTYFLLPYCNL